MENYTNYILTKGRFLNDNLKYNLYPNQNEYINLLLFDYILDTFNNYDYRNCPNYEDKETSIEIEDFSVYELIDTDQFNILTEDGEIILLNFARNYNHEDFIINETEDKEIITEADIYKYKYDKENIKKYLYKLAKNLKCYD